MHYINTKSTKNLINCIHGVIVCKGFDYKL